MSSIIKSISDVFTSLVELVWSFFTTAGDLVQKTASFVLKFFSEVLDLLVNFFRGLIDLAGGIVGFVLGGLLGHVCINSGQVLIDCRQHSHAWRPCGHRLWLLAVPAQPGQHRQGGQQEAQLDALGFAVSLKHDGFPFLTLAEYV